MSFSHGLGGLFEQDHATFDFNLQFEQLFFSIVPSAFFILSSLWRVLYQARKPAIVHSPTVQWIKLGAIATYVGLELSLLVLSIVGSLQVTGLFVAVSALKLASALFMMVLSVVDHSRSPRPSILLNSYLFLTLLLDGAQARTLFLSSGDRPEIGYSSIFTAAIALKLGIFLLEARQKSRWISWDMKEHSPEETSSIFSLGVYFWLNRLFLVDYSKVLKVKDLYPLDSTLDAKLLHDKFSANMEYGKLKGDNFGLVKVLIRTLNINLLLPIPPRVAMLGFTLAQHFFTQSLLEYLSRPERDPNVGYGFIGASILIYSGIAVSAALCWYFHRRALTMARSMLITETYIKATKARLGTGDDNAAVTLMSTDIERINMGFMSLHETWASLIQAALASWLLYNQLGAAFAAPIATVTICFLGLAILVKYTGDSQRSRYAEVIKVTALGFDLATLPQNDMTNIGSDGITLSGGQKQRVSLARALYLQSDLLVLDDIFSGLDADTEEQVFRQVFSPDGLLRRRGTTVALCTHSIRHLPVADHIIALGDGTVIEQGTFEELMARDGYIRRLGLRSGSESDTSSEEIPSERHNVKTEAQQLCHASTNTALEEEDIGELRQTGDKKVYKHYFKSMGVILAICSFFIAALWGFFRNFPTVWLTYWTNDVYSEHPTHTYAYYAGIYAILQISATISLLLLGIAIFIISVRRAGANIHQDALRTLMRAPLSFFTTTDTGVVTNLFSQDLNLIDTELPNALLNTLFCVFQAIGQAAVMLTSSPYLAISYPFIGVLLYVVQRFYLRTSRQLRLLDLQSKSPLYTHFIDSVKGMGTLRAFVKWRFVPNDVQKNARLINTSQRPVYLLVMIQQWLSLVLDLAVAVLAAAVTALAVKLHSNSSFAGASLVTLMSFGDSLSGIVIYLTRLETSIGAITRLQTFNETVKPEDKSEEDLIPPED
ncbi:hypothetical protein CHU98_g1837 [Xylaria longipes]|nr:hypothetical protein CHU98_g1837 [Xylaria longipes]